MFSIKVKMLDEDMMVRVMIECETHYALKNYKDYVDCNIEHKDRKISILQSKAYKYFSELESCLKDIINNKKYSISKDLEQRLNILKIDIPKEFEKYFADDYYSLLCYETTPMENGVKEKDILNLLEWHLRRVSDYVDLLT